MITTKFTARIKRGSVDAPNGSFLIPSSFGLLQDLLSNKTSHPYIQLEKSLTCLFIPDNLIGDIPDFLLIDDEVCASSVFIERVFIANDQDLPFITASAEFIFPTTHKITQTELNAWEENNEFLDNAISFEWLLKPKDVALISNVLTEYDELSFTVANT